MACKDIGRRALDLPPNKAARVAAMLSEISSSDIVTRVAESVQLDSYANEVRRHIQDPTQRMSGTDFLRSYKIFKKARYLP
jgi:hypothetical protein